MSKLRVGMVVDPWDYPQWNRGLCSAVRRRIVGRRQLFNLYDPLEMRLSQLRQSFNKLSILA